MTSTVLFLEKLKAIGVRLSLTDDKLHIQAPRGALTPDIRTQLQQRGNEVATYLRELREGLLCLPPIVSSDLISAHLVDSPLSFNQQHIWHKQKVSHNPARFNCPTLIELHGDLDLDRFEMALNVVIKSHAALRTVIVEDAGEPKQHALDQVKVKIVTVDLRDEPLARRKAVFQHKVVQVIEQPFSLTTGPLLRAYIFRTAEQTYNLLLVVHQLIFDERSLSIILRNWSDIYAQLTTSAESAVSSQVASLNDDESVEYGDYVSWQRWPGMYDRQIAYWREQLADLSYGPPPLCLLPTDWVRPKVQSDRGARITHLIDRELLSGLNSLSKQQDVTLRTLLLTAYTLLLARLSGLDEIVIGTDLPARTQVTLANVVGFFANTVILRTDVRDSPTFTQLLRRVTQVSLGAQANQDVPFARMLEALRSEGNLSINALIQTAFNMPIQAEEPFTIAGVENQQGYLPEPTVLYDFTLNILTDDKGLLLEAVYRRELFAPQRIIEMLKQLEFILMQAVVAHNRPTANYSLSPNLAKLSSSTTDEYAEIGDYIEQNSRQQPNKIAVADNNVQFSYSELNAKANQVANYLHNKGVTPGKRVVIIAARGVALVPVMLGVIKAGVAFALIDPTEPTRRSVNRLAALQATAAIVIQDADPLPVMLDQWISQLNLCFRYPLDEGWPANSATPPVIDIGLDTPIYITFSEESRKQLPVEITQRSLVHLLNWQQHTFGLQATDRFAFLAPLYSDTVLRDILLPLIMGASLYIPTVAMLTVNLGRWLMRKHITVCNLTIGQAENLSARVRENSDTASLRTIFFADAQLEEAQIRALRQQFSRVELVTLYGSAESGLVSGYHIIPSAGLLLENDVIPLGKGIAGFDLLVLNEHGQLAGIGELGEIFVRSPYLAQGYLNRPKLTATHFVMSHRFGRMWRTRDFGRIRPDGLIELVAE